MSGHVEPHLFIIFGATGDLFTRKLGPALYHLREAGYLPENSPVLGVGRKQRGDSEFRLMTREAMVSMEHATGHPATMWCEGCLYYQGAGDYEPATFLALRHRIEALERELRLPGNRVIYLALPPEAFSETITALGEAGLNESPGWTRLVVEKPLGRDLKSAVALNRIVERHFDERQTYRMDHYLGKETVQNLLVFRFANAIFESQWNRNSVERVEIMVPESLGVEARAGYYDQSGALRDMIQNHLTQLLCLMGMEVPGTFDADAIRQEKDKLLRSVAPIRPEDVVFGQYTAGEISGRPVPGYLQEPGIAPGSGTETYAAVRLHVENWRWQGVPFYLWTGKRLAAQLSQITVTFRCPPLSIFKPHADSAIHGNVLAITLQPEEGFELHFEVKEPGQPLRIQSQSLRFRYSDAFAQRIPEPYETLLLDVMRGNQTLFVSAGWVEASWRLFSPLLYGGLPVYPYPAGSWGPLEARSLLGEDPLSRG